MLTRVYLEGALGEEFGKEWDLQISTPKEALDIIDANGIPIMNWLRNQAKTYPNYQIVVEYESGRTEEVSEETLHMNREMKTVTFVPVIEGAGAMVRIVVGVVLLFVPGMQQVGISLIIGGIIETFMSKPSNARVASDNSSDKSKKSDYFDGPVNTTYQGVPVPLIYGRCLVGSHVISASLEVFDDVIEDEEE